MIVQAIIFTLQMMISIVFSWLPDVVTLPPIIGVDIDTALVGGMGFFNTVTHSFWMLADVMSATVFLLGYYGIKNLVLRFFLGHRAP